MLPCQSCEVGLQRFNMQQESLHKEYHQKADTSNPHEVMASIRCLFKTAAYRERALLSSWITPSDLSDCRLLNSKNGWAAAKELQLSYHTSDGSTDLATVIQARTLKSWIFRRKVQCGSPHVSEAASPVYGMGNRAKLKRRCIKRDRVFCSNTWILAVKGVYNSNVT